MNYNVSIIEANGFLTRRVFSDSDLFRLEDLKKIAHDRAVKCLPFSQYDDSITHLVYYHEVQIDENNIDVDIRMNPTGVNDELFYDFVDTWKPLYVGAIHRH